MWAATAQTAQRSVNNILYLCFKQTFTGGIVKLCGGLLSQKSVFPRGVEFGVEWSRAGGKQWSKNGCLPEGEERFPPLLD